MKETVNTRIARGQWMQMHRNLENDKQLFCSVCGLSLLLLEVCIKMHRNCYFQTKNSKMFWGALPRLVRQP